MRLEQLKYVVEIYHTHSALAGGQKPLAVSAVAL